MSFKIQSRYEPLGRLKSLSRLFHYVLLHKITNEGQRGVLRGSSSDDQASKVLRRLLLKLKRIFCMVFSVKRYVTLGDARHCVFIVVSLKRGSQNPNGHFVFYLEWNLLGINGERSRISRRPMWHLVIC